MDPYILLAFAALVPLLVWLLACVAVTKIEKHLERIANSLEAIARNHDMH